MVNGIISAREFHLDDPIMYILYGVVVAFIIALSVFYLVLSLKKAKKLNMDMGKIRQVITSSITFSILPALGIALGVVTLVGSLGVAFPAIRLSVIGSLQYEAQMADAAANAITGSTDGTGLSILMKAGLTAQDMVTIATVMTVAICFGGIEVLFFYKRLQPTIGKFMSMTTSSGGSNINIGDLVFQVSFIGMVLGYLAMSITSITGGIQFLDSYYNFIAVIVAMIIMYLCDLLINKANIKWLDNFSIPLSMIIAMIVVGAISFCANKYGWALAPTDAVVPVV
ncbi:MAG: DUF5058 family protein [Clostridia bacterium]|nr:DUF5058 family protein [Clostridia bacterium]